MVASAYAKDWLEAGVWYLQVTEDHQCSKILESKGESDRT